jgi:hypothetical protein
MYYTKNEYYGEKFYQLPKLFFTSPVYKTQLNDREKIAFAMLKDRFSLSAENEWFDDKGRIYFIFTLDELQEIFGCARDTAVKIKKALIKADLLEDIRVGQGNPNRLYLKKPIVTEEDCYKIKKAESLEAVEKFKNPTSEIQKFKNPTSSSSEPQKFKNQTSENPTSESPEIQLPSYSINTELKETEINNKKAKALADKILSENISKKEGISEDLIEILTTWDFDTNEIEEISTKLTLENLIPDDKMMVEQCKHMFDNPQVTGSKVGYFVNGIRFKLKPVQKVVPIQPNFEEALRPSINSDQLEALMKKVFPEHPADVLAIVRRVFMKYRNQISLTDYQIILNEFKPKINQSRNGNTEAFLSGFVKSYLNPAPLVPVGKRKSAETETVESEKEEVTGVVAEKDDVENNDELEEKRESARQKFLKLGIKTKF